MINDWNNKVVLVTGAATGIGRATSLELASRGALVYVSALSEEEAEPVVEEIISKGGKAFAIQIDVNNNKEFEKTLKTIKDQQGKIDLLINNAGILFVGEFYDMEEAFIEKLLATNLNAVVMGSYYAYHIMKQQGHGMIVNVSSMAGFLPAPAMTVYGAAKHGVLGFSTSLATEAEKFGVDVRAVCFGLIKSNLLNTAEMKHGNTESVYQMLSSVKELSAEEAAKMFVEQMGTSKKIITIPFYARLTWWLNRLSPTLLIKGGLDTMRKYREIIAGSR